MPRPRSAAATWIAIDQFFGPGAVRETIENWAEVAWAYAEGRRQDAARTYHPRVRALADRVLKHLEGVDRPATLPTEGLPVICPRFRVGDKVIQTLSAVVRFEHATEVTLSELRVELIFPADADGDAFFRGLTQSKTRPAPR